ncbi:Chitin binding protein, partial [Olavius sp. associated proteobacterium Delta 1]
MPSDSRANIGSLNNRKPILDSALPSRVKIVRRLVLCLFLISVSIFFFPAQVFADLSQGLVAYYPFNGNANDESGNGNHGVVYGAMAAEDRFGTLDSAYEFDGVSSYIEIADNTALRISGTDFTLSAEVLVKSYNSSYQSALLVKRGTGLEDGWFWSLLGLASESEDANPGNLF